MATFNGQENALGLSARSAGSYTSSAVAINAADEDIFAAVRITDVSGHPKLTLKLEATNGGVSWSEPAGVDQPTLTRVGNSWLYLARLQNSSYTQCRVVATVEGNNSPSVTFGLALWVMQP